MSVRLVSGPTRPAVPFLPPASLSGEAATAIAYLLSPLPDTRGLRAFALLGQRATEYPMSDHDTNKPVPAKPASLVKAGPRTNI
jgi:hypothetical protein